MSREERASGGYLPDLLGGGSRPALRVATPADAAAIIGLWEACDLTRPWNDPSADFALAVAGATSAVLIDDDGSQPRGTVMVGFDGHRGWVYYLAVAPTLREQGIGRCLMAAAAAWLRKRGAPKLQLMVRGDNAAALGFYETIGLERQDVVVLGRFLDDGART